jgi:hypothetical protein
MQVLFAVGLLTVTFGGCAGQSLQHVVERDLLSRDGLTCRGYLGWNSPDVRHVFVWMNGFCG